MVMYSTLEDIQTGMQDSLFSDDQINLRSEQRDAIDHAKEHFCKRSGRKGEYQYAVLISGTPRCVLVKPSVPCSLCVN